MKYLETDRLLLSRLSYDDCDFILELVNEPSFKRYIGDKNVNSLEDARRYLREGPIALYEKFGYGLFLVKMQGTETRTGICGLVKREEFADPDLGFAFLKRYRQNGYATEAAKAAATHAIEVLKLRRIIAIADPDNKPSIRVLENLGFAYEREARMRDDDQDINVYSIEN